MRGPLVTRRVVVPVVCAALTLFVGWSLAPGASAETSRLPSQRTTTTVAPPATTTTAMPATSEPPVPTVANETKTVETKGEIDDPAQKKLRWIIIGLIGLAVLILILTIWFWRATRPSRLAAKTSTGGTATNVGVTSLAEAMALGGATSASATSASAVTDSVRISGKRPPVPPGHRPPIWADEHISAGTAKQPASGPDVDQ